MLPGTKLETRSPGLDPVQPLRYLYCIHAPPRRCSSGVSASAEVPGMQDLHRGIGG